MQQKKRNKSNRATIKSKFLFPLIFMGWQVLSPSAGWTYEAVSKFSGEQLTGTVTLKGKIPPLKRFNLVLFSDPYYCGRISDGRGWRISPLPLIGKHNELAGAVVFLKEVKRGKPSITTSTIIQAKNCVFRPYVSAIQIGQPFHFQNWDPIQHKLEVFLTTQKGAQSLLAKNLKPHPDNRKQDFLSSKQTGLHRSGPEVQYQFDRPGVLVFRCRLHDYMQSWTVVLPHPYFSMTSENGEFSIKDIPPGEYQLIVWHPLGKQETTIEVGDKRTPNINILLTPNSPTIYPEEKLGHNPYGIDLIGDSSIVPTIERQKWNPDNENPIGDPS